MPFFILISVGFLIINFFIISSDVRQKKIPNRYLLFLLSILGIYYIYLYIYGFQFSGYFFIQIFVSFIISFVLYYFGIWSAGDAKYLLVLTLFMPDIGIIPFIGNIALITILYLILYFIYFYLKLIFNKIYRKSLMSIIFIDYKDTFMNFIKNPHTGEITRKSIIIKIFKQAIYFLLFFTSMRLLRGDMLDYIRTTGYIKNNLGDFGSYIFLLIGLISLILMFLYKKMIGKILKFLITIKNRFHISIPEDTIKIINISVSLFLLICILIFDYQRIGNELFHKLYTILTLYLLLYLLIKILFYGYKLTFQVAEQDYITVKELKEGDIVDREFLIKMFGKQESLGYGENKKGMFYPDPGIYFNNIENPIDQETVTTLNKIYNIVHLYHKKHDKKFKKNEEIKILKTFAFGGYIFIGFLVTYIWGDSISRFIIQNGIVLFKHFTQH